MSVKTIPSVRVVTCDRCGHEERTKHCIRNRGELRIVVDPTSGMRGDTRKADLCPSCTSTVVSLLVNAGIKVLEHRVED